MASGSEGTSVKQLSPIASIGTEGIASDWYSCSHEAGLAESKAGTTFVQELPPACADRVLQDRVS